MAGTWPNLDAGDLETRVRTYLNEVTADFFTQAEIWRWLSVAAKDIAQKTLCVRRIIDAVTTSSVRNVTTSAYKVLHVEYVPASGRPTMLTKIDPLRLGNYVSNGTTPQYWYEFGSATGIEPLPDATYNLRLYVADLPKMQYTTYPLTAWNALWTKTGDGTWSHGAGSNVYSGTGTQAAVDTVTTPILVNSTNYTFTITISAVTTCGLVITAGTVASPNFTTAGIHSFTATTASTALTLTATCTATGGLTVDDLYILKEADFAATTDQTELPCAWQHLLALYATHGGLTKDRKYGPAQMLESIYNNELAYLRQAIVEVIPDGRNSLIYK